GITGCGKTFTMANVIARVNKPTIVISHNKTLAAQLFGEYTGFFPRNAVEYFISYYDYYQPEAYLPPTDTYIGKDASINDEIDKLRLRATSALVEREDVVIVASVSCIYGLGSPEDYKNLVLRLKRGDTLTRKGLLKRLVVIQYQRNDVDFLRGTFRVRGDVVEIHPAYEENAIRIEFFGDKVENLSLVDPLTFQKKEDREWIHIYPARHFVTTKPKIEEAIRNIEIELEARIEYFEERGKLLEAQRLKTRTRYDIELLREVGYCPGIENYSRHLSGRPSGSRPACLLDFFPDDFLCIIDESHVSIPQLVGMYHADRSRKETLVEYGFRLPSALDNRPLVFDEFLELVPQIIFTSATPREFEYRHSSRVVEQIIRPTGIPDPKMTVKPKKGEIDDLIEEIRKRVDRKERVLVTTLTKRMAEELTDYLARLDIRVRYIHSEIGAIERVDILRDLRLSEFDCLVGVNLLREGLDLPEVSLIAVLDADNEGFLRSYTALIQTAGRAARNVNGEVIMYADDITDSMKKTIKETERRRKAQLDYNVKHNITPRTIYKTRKEILQTTSVADAFAKEQGEEYEGIEGLEEIDRLIKLMRKLAEEEKFEEAIKVRNRIRKLQSMTRKNSPLRHKDTKKYK
ncbi:excinuclease ABC subunit B, partial [candidate division WOR-3 bacterium JGI_Cruoil_03_44_89]